MVLKGVNFRCWGLHFTMYIPNGLERSYYCMYALWSWKESNSDDLPYRPLRWSWKKSLLSANFLLVLNLGLPLYPVGCHWWCFPLVKLKVHVWVLCQHDGVWWKLVQTGVSSCLWVRSPLSWAPQMILWMEIMQGVSMTVIWVNSASGVMMGVM